MIIYIEDTFFYTFILSLMVMLLSLSMNRQKITFTSTLFLSLLITAFNILLVILPINHTYMLILKAIFPFLISIFCFKDFNFKKILSFYITFVSFTCILSTLQNLFTIYLDFNISPLFLCIIVGAVSLTLFSLIHKFYHIKKISKFEYDLILKNKDKVKYIKGYLDSGNLLQDEITSLPILLLDYESFESLFSINIIDCLSKTLDKKLNGRYITVSSVSGTSQIFVTKIDSISLVDGSQIKALVGLSVTKFSNGFSALLSPLML